jgi:hypothetical protein
LVDVDGGNERILLRGEDRGDRVGERNCDLIAAGLFDAQFSPDGEQVFFSGYCAATSLQLQAVEVATGRPRSLQLSSNGGHVVLHDTPYAGHIIVQRRRYHEEGGTYTWCYLFDPQGHEIAALGDCESAEDRESVRRRFDDWLRGGKVSRPTPR